MSKKDYEKFAEMFRELKSEKEGFDLYQVSLIQDKVASIFARDSRRFDAVLFHKACEVDFEDRDNTRD